MAPGFRSHPYRLLNCPDNPAGRDRLLRQEPDFAEMFALCLVRQRGSDQANIANHLTNSSEKRLAWTLLRCADFTANADSGSIPSAMNQAVLAGVVGTTRPRVSHFMNRFRRQGFIAYNRPGYVTVHRALENVLDP